ncbi:MAG: hypothetical protein K6F14_06300 [Clostridiales bacterium]|nr:hypothetical protein [Clostridiales bacterium]
MVNQSERLLNAFSELYFYKELTFSDLKYRPQGQTERELADILIKVKNYVLAIQLKARNTCDRTEDETNEEKWLEKKCRIAKSQIEETIKIIESGTPLMFNNNRGDTITIDNGLTVVPLVMFMNPTIKKYNRILLKHSEIGMDINCISYEDFCYVCKMLITPMEIIDYFIWRKEKYLNNYKTETLICIDEDGFSLSSMDGKEPLLGIFLHEKYGINSIIKNKTNLNTFRFILLNLKERLVAQSQDNASIELVDFFSALTRIEINALVERLNSAIEYSKDNKEKKIIGTLRTEEYCIFVMASKDNSEMLDYYLNIVLEKVNTPVLVGISVYWENKKEFRIDFIYKNILL